jgi:hypothetical protein
MVTVIFRHLPVALGWMMFVFGQCLDSSMLLPRIVLLSGARALP